ncbi:MAG: tRNA pseudouridine(38-40) synthase TruA [Chloroflexi bacterium RBG_13_52_12]|nr:MAG: tRNA pseudouridine(38-40) synthase TruA [Chloroflexi bacterium RBG_13_52_12]
MAADPTPGNGIVLIIEYNGTGYHGSQLQKNAPTIQGELEKALNKLTGERIRIKTASRTDAGVHARGQVVSFCTVSALPLKSFIDGLNHYLPRDIAVKEAFKTNGPFDVRRRAVSREYKYYILISRTRSPMRQGFSCRVTGDLDINAMNRACQALIGRHDFASFVSSAETARQKRTVRDVFKAEITQDGDMIVFGIIANSFLPHQVRNMIGSLIKVGQGKMTVDEFISMVRAKTPGLASPTAPADGLCLVRINYPGPFEGDSK